MRQALPAFFLSVSACGSRTPNVCPEYVACAEVVHADDISTLRGVYGLGGTCWDRSLREQERCRAVCEERLPICEEARAEIDTDEDTAEPSLISYRWTEDALSIEVAGATTGFSLGMAETIDPTQGWFGEDCLNGTMEWRLCHHFDGPAGELTSLYDEIIAGDAVIDDVRAGETTVFEKAHGDFGRLTYVLTTDAGDCWTWGHDPTYYTSSPEFEGCSAL